MNRKQAGSRRSSRFAAGGGGLRGAGGGGTGRQEAEMVVDTSVVSSSLQALQRGIYCARGSGQGELWRKQLYRPLEDAWEYIRSTNSRT